MLSSIQTKLRNLGLRQSVFATLMTIFIVYGIWLVRSGVVFGQSMMASHMEPHLGIASLHYLFAVGISIIIFLIKKLRKQKIWFYLPAIIAISATLFSIIVSQYPCCSGG